MVNEEVGESDEWIDFYFGCFRVNQERFHNTTTRLTSDVQTTFPTVKRARSLLRSKQQACSFMVNKSMQDLV